MRLIDKLQLLWWDTIHRSIKLFTVHIKASESAYWWLSWSKKQRHCWQSKNFVNTSTPIFVYIDPDWRITLCFKFVDLYDVCLFVLFFYFHIYFSQDWTRIYFQNKTFRIFFGLITVFSATFCLSKRKILPDTRTRQKYNLDYAKIQISSSLIFPNLELCDATYTNFKKLCILKFYLCRGEKLIFRKPFTVVTRYNTKL